MKNNSLNIFDTDKLKPWLDNLSLNAHTKKKNSYIKCNSKFFYQLAVLSLEDIKTTIEEEKTLSPSNLKKMLTKPVCGASPLHWAILNPNQMVFEYIYQTYIDFKLDTSKYEYVKEERTYIFKNRPDMTILESESLLNLAFRLKDNEKILSLQEKNLTHFSLAPLPEKIKNFVDENSFKHNSSLLFYCLLSLHFDREKSDTNINHVAAYYFDFVSQVSSLDDEIQELFKDKQSTNQFGIYLLFYEPLYSQHKFQSILPRIFNQYLNDINEQKVYIYYTTQSLNVLDNFIQQLYKNSSYQMLLEISQAIEKFDKKSMLATEIQNKFAIFENKFNILFEKKSIEEQIKPKDSLRQKKIKI